MIKKKKILIISRSFYPHNSPRSFRTTELVKEFSRLGHEVTLLTHKIDKVHSEFESQYNVKIKDLGKRFLPRIKIGHGNKFLNIFKRLLRRGLILLFVYPDIELMYLVNKSLKSEFDYDLLISIAVPHTTHWGVALSRNNNHQIAKIWVADCGDPFYLNIHDTFKKLFYLKYLEKWYSRKADYISIPFEGLKKYFFKEFDDKYKIIPQGFNFDNIKIFDGEINNKDTTFAYAGGFIKESRDPAKFFDFLLTIEKPFKFIIYNEQKEFTDPYKTKLGDKLVLRNYIPREKLIYELSKMDFLVNFEYNPTNQAPSKLIDYSFTKRPILLIKNESFDENLIKDFLLKNYTNQFIIDNIDRFNIKNVAQQFLELI